MKLLLDQNLSVRLVSSLSEDFPGSTHVRQLGLESATDREICSFAAQNGFTVLTKDSDFFDLASLHGHPPKIVWIRAGNASSAAIQRLLESETSRLLAFEADDNASLLVLRLPHQA